ncbi:efflux transporter outer membrane subunit [Duganella sp. FT27W]|uniref:efflux transporter outer membrane subunit n=1 Tax=Duganella sp. FT27W TaxID=2654636 RepID=UPI00128C4005|nr:efflux transporter outer membrane subunit [Duganella sp. FT27W]MPQ55292.1 efflux transporter outer membrane subunit [Duganella sp. FT27W]
MKKVIAAQLVAIALAMLIAGCAAGPDFVAPAAPTVQRYTAQILDGEAAQPGHTQKLAAGQEVPARWWTSFGSEPLNALVAAALAANPDLQAAQAALQAARENAAAQRGLWWPDATLQVSPTRQRVADTLSSPTAAGANLYSLHTAQLNVGYSPDVFGGVRRQAEAARAQVDVARYQGDAARLTLAANVVLAAISEAALRAQLDVTRELADLARRQLDATRAMQRAGQVGSADVAAQEAALAQVEAGVPPLEKQAAQQRNLLAVLGGRTPADGAGAAALDFDSLVLAGTLPVSVPARLVEHRPDIRAAEAQLHAASAQVGVARAARLPNIALTATLGSSALDAGTLFKSGAGFWSIGADLVQPLFKGGALRHQQRAAEAAYTQASFQYRSVVLTAFQNVADALHAVDADARALRSADAAEQAARRSLGIAQRQWQLGALAYPAVLLAQQSWQQASVALIAARAARYADTVALFQALGGGWTDDLQVASAGRP